MESICGRAITSPGAGKVPSVNTVRESRGLAQAPVRGGEGAKCELVSLAPTVRQGRGREAKGLEVDIDISVRVGSAHLE